MYIKYLPGHRFRNGVTLLERTRPGAKENKGIFLCICGRKFIAGISCVSVRNDTCGCRMGKHGNHSRAPKLNAGRPRKPIIRWIFRGRVERGFMKNWLIAKLKLAEPLNRESAMENPKGVAMTASKKLGLLGYGSGDLLLRAFKVETPQECAAILVDCLALLPDEDVFAPKDAAKMLAVTTAKVVGWIETGELKATNLSKGLKPRWIISKDDLETFLASRQPEAIV